ncbi:MAG: protein kinase, partial [bacterium]
MIGKTISHYKILKKLGQGGMGEVYLAEDSKLHRKVALKFLFQELYEDYKNKERFEREARAVAALTHPNIVVVYEIDEFEAQIYISMEYIQGESLRHYIDNQKFSLNESLEIILQVCQGLSTAHEADIVHRDIKPENIMIGRDARVKIVDFGLAKLKNLGALTTLGTQIGTVQYMSPEQARGEEIDQASDIFSLGAIFYELLSGQLAFSGNHPVETIYSIINEEPESLPDVPDDLYKIIEKALKKKQEERYSTVREMISELHTYQRRLEMDEGASTGGNVGLESSSNFNAGVDNIRDLLSQRRRIDDLILSKYTKDVTIMFSDVVSSVAYFERKGDVSGRAMLHRYTRLMTPLIEQHSGHMIKTSGDAILAYFTEAANGCRCSIAMQKVLRKQTLAQPEEDRIAIRIALHFGRAVIEKDDVYGDIVNVVARVEQRATANEILLSDSVVQQVKDNSEFVLAFVCKERLKGKSEKIEIYRLRWQEDELIGEKIADKGKGELSPADGSFAHSPESTIGRDETEISRQFDPQMDVEGEEKGLAKGLKNPYMNRVKIKNIDEFYGRKSEVSKIFSRIGSSRPQSVSIVGERRIGKSSLLNYLCHPKIRMTYLQRPNDYRFVFIDFQEKRGIGLPTFFQSIYAFLLDESKGGLALDVQPDYEGFKKVV